MAGYGDLVFRAISRDFGCHLVYTEMISAEGLIRENRQTWNILDMENEPPPVGVQIFGNRADSLAEAARILQDQGAALIDLNLGCSVRKVVRSGCGASLLESPETLMSIARSLRKALTIPLTVKMRSGTERRPRCALEIGPMLEKEGVDAICLHPRTREQIFQGRADWRLIGELKGSVNIPVIGNGDVRTGTDARKMREETHCDGIMIGRGALGNPWLFMESQVALGEISRESVPPNTFGDRTNLALRHLEQMIHRKGEHTGMAEFRKHCVYYFTGYPGAREIRSKFFRLNRYEEAKEFLTRIACERV